MIVAQTLFGLACWALYRELVTFLAAIGLRHLAAAAKVVRRRGGRLILLNPAAAVADMIRRLGLIEYVPIERAGPGATLAA